jgi:hypothetical protein
MDNVSLNPLLVHFINSTPKVHMQTHTSLLQTSTQNNHTLLKIPLKVVVDPIT